jgi:hypothetical protein
MGDILHPTSRMDQPWVAVYRHFLALDPPRFLPSLLGIFLLTVLGVGNLRVIAFPLL